MKLKLLAFLLLLNAAFYADAQSNLLKINANIVLPKDSLESSILISSLNSFLIASRMSNEENNLVLESQKVETFILLDEIRGIEKNTQLKDDFFYKPYLNNLMYLNANQYLVQVSYIGISDTSVLLRASFELIAHKVGGKFLFSSPLIKNTQNWKVKKVENNFFWYQTGINQSKVKAFSKLAATFDKKLKSKDKVTVFYCCDNIIELQKLVGVDYKSDYNGRKESVWGAKFGNKKVIVLGNKNASFDNFDAHDLWHDRLSLVISRSEVNKPVDEGCAYVYGGSWGLSWETIFTSFKEQIAKNKNTNWMEIKETPIYFKTNGFSNSADYIVNALLVKKIENEKGFEGVWEFLNCGKFEKGNDNYYKILEKLTGITKVNYNEKVWELINNE